MKTLPSSLIAVALCLSAIPSALGQISIHEDGFEKEPRCFKPATMQRVLDSENLVATHLVAKSPRFDLTIHMKKVDGKYNPKAWALVGDNRNGRLCNLDAHDVKLVTEMHWFPRYFSKDLLK